MIGVEPEIIKRAEANGVSVLIGRKRFRAPGDSRWIGGINVPRGAAISLISYRAIVQEARVLRWRMEPDVSNIDSSSYRYSERLNRSIEVLVVHCVLIVPDAGIWSRHLVTNEENAIACGRCPRSWLELIYRRCSPGFNSWLLSDSRANSAETEVRRPATHGLLFVGSVVIHVALSWMTLAPDAFVRDDVIGFGKIGGPRVLCWNQISRLHQNSVRGYVMIVTGVIIRCKT